MLDWTRLRSYQVSPANSFEELCYQIARAEYADKGKLLSIDDSGGGDGVEFYLELPDGGIWGWQAKFFPNERLTASRRAQVVKSLKKAVEVHGDRLKCWFLCVPLNLVPKGKYSETKWWRDTLPTHAPGVELTFWGASELYALVQKPGREGIRACFFGDLPLNEEWFQARLGEQLATVHDKYDSALHVETAVDAEIGALLASPGFDRKLSDEVAEIKHAEDELLAAITILEQEAAPALLRTAAASGLEDEETPAAAAARRRLPFLHAIADKAARMRAALETLLAMAGVDLTDRRDAVRAALATWEPFKSGFDAYIGSDRAEDELTERALNAVRSSGTSLRRLFEFRHLHQSMPRFLDAELNILGEAGVGKTHVSCHAAASVVARGAPAMLLLGGQFERGTPPQAQILQRFQVPVTYSWDTFLGALDAYAAARHTRTLIMIDALNEAHSPDLWRANLPGLVASVARFPRVALATTCRPLYVEAIWPGAGPRNRMDAQGFSASETRDAVAKYFARYKIEADLRLASLAPFRLPIYLSLFCRAKNAEAVAPCRVVLGEQTMYEVFAEYLVHADVAIRARLNRRGVPNLVGPKLASIAGELWMRGVRDLPLDEACQLLDGKPVAELDWEGSLTHAVLDEGLLLRRDFVQNSGREVMAFSYDLLAGLEIAKQLVSGKEPGEVRALVSSAEFVRAVASPDFGERHPLAEDILRGLAAVLPRAIGQHLYQISDDATVYGSGIASLVDAPAAEVTGADVDEVRRLLLRSPHNVAVFAGLSSRTAFIPDHPLNAEFLDAVLREMPMPQRDEGWTEAVRHNQEVWTDEVEEFERFCRDTAVGADTVADNRIRLGALRYRWLLTSTVRQLRDVATRAFYWYGRRDPRALFDLTIGSFEIDDPYVRERLVAACYGTVMALHADPVAGESLRVELPSFVRQLYALMFAPDATHGTTHALLRDYARFTIALALRHDPALLAADEVARTIPPFRAGVGPQWGELEDPNAGEYRDGNDPFGLDFGNYTVGRLTPDRSNYDAQHPEYQRVVRQMRWRMAQLGYEFERFREVDQEIARSASLSRSDDNENRTDRYGKKYAWIAFFEQYGMREDQGELDREWPDPRPSDVDIDPSFPGKGVECAFVPDDLLGDRALDLDEWLRDGPGPDLGPYLVLDELAGEAGPWVLLDGYVSQEDLGADRTFFAFPRGLLVRRGVIGAFARLLADQPLGGRWISEIDQDHYLFAGEIPWSPLYPENGWTSFRLGGRNDSPDAAPRDFDVLLPVRSFAWESYHTGTAGGGTVYVPARELAEPLGLWLRVPDWDWYDDTGRLSARWVRASLHGGHQYALFVRQEALQTALAATGTELVWGVWGERRVARHEHVMARKADNSDYVVYQAVYRYDGTAAQLVPPAT